MGSKVAGSFIVKMLWGERRRGGYGTIGAISQLPMERPMSQFFDASRSLTALEQDSTIIAAIEMSQSKWLVAAVGAKRSLAQTDGRTIELWGGISARRDLENRVFDS